MTVYLLVPVSLSALLAPIAAEPAARVVPPRYPIRSPQPPSRAFRRTPSMPARYSKKLITFTKLQGGQYGTLDVSLRDTHDVELALGGDFVWLTRGQWSAFRSVMDRAFGIEAERVVIEEDWETRGPRGEGTFRAAAVVDEDVPSPPPPPRRSRKRSATA